MTREYRSLKYTYGRLLGYLMPHWNVLLISMIAMVFYSLANAAVPYLMETIIDALGSLNELNSYFVPVLLLIIFTVRGITDVVTVYGLGWLGRRVIRDLRSEIFNKYLVLPTSYYEATSSGSMISKLTYNTEQVAQAISDAIVVLVRDSLTIVVLVIAMIYYSPSLTLIVFLLVPFIAILIRVMSRAFRKYSVRIQDSMADATKSTEEIIHGHRDIKIYQAEGFQSKRFMSINRENYKSNLKIIAVRAIGDAMTQYVLALGIAFIVWITLSSSEFIQLDAPSFMAFLTAMGMLLAPIKRLTNINAAVQRGIASSGVLFEIIDTSEERDQGTINIEAARGEIKFSNVTFAYRNDDEVALDDVSLMIKEGTSVAFVGRSGAGKTSLVSLIPRFYEVEEGTIFLDGKNIQDLTMHSLRKQISLVSQDIVLLEGTIAENISYGMDKNIDQESILSAIEYAHLTELIQSLPNGIHSNIGERGAMLSGGQKQRIAIARAIIKDAPILILDEATSSLDSESERYIRDSIAKLMQGRTTLIIAHRFTFTEHVDKIYVLDEGKIIEEGTHSQLLETDGVYRSLYNMQAH